jgi:hypothetical protein
VTGQIDRCLQIQMPRGFQSRLNIDNDPLVPRESRAAVVGYSEDNVHRTRAGWHHAAGFDNEPGLGLVEIPDIQLDAGGRAANLKMGPENQRSA